MKEELPHVVIDLWRQGYKTMQHSHVSLKKWLKKEELYLCLNSVKSGDKIEKKNEEMVSHRGCPWLSASLPELR
jgi:hypothetical protein